MKKKPYPWYYAVNDRPVKIVRLPNGGADCLVFDFDTGGFTPDRAYLAYLVPGSGKDVDQLTEAEFERLVEARRVDAASLRREAPIRWSFSTEGGPGYQATHRGRSYRLRMNPPGEHPYTLFVDGQEVEALAGWPAAWARVEDEDEETGDSREGPSLEAALLREWSRQLCRIASTNPGEIAARLGLEGSVIDHLTYSSLEPPPAGTTAFTHVGHTAGFDYIEIALSGSTLTRAQLDAHFGEGGYVPRLHPESLHKIAYYVEVPGAPWKCAVFAGFKGKPVLEAAASKVLLRRDRAYL